MALALNHAVPARAGQARATFIVSATITETFKLRLLNQQQTLVVSEADVKRGYVDVRAASLFEVASNAPCLLEFRATGGIFRRVRVSGASGAITFGTDGGTVPLSHDARGGVVTLDYRFELAEKASPGQYAWPLLLTLLPM